MEQSSNAGPPSNWRIPQWFPDLNATQHDALKSYHTELLKFNPKINLISRRTEPDADQVHFADSIMAGKLILSRSKSSLIVDIGSGNGFPGLVMAMLASDRVFLMLDKDSRKLEFIKHVAAKVGLKNVQTYHGQVESYPENSIECGVSRGFASLSSALMSTRKCFKQSGEYYHMKGSIWVREMAEIPTQLCSSWAPGLVADYKLPASTISLSLVVAKKTV